LAFFTENKYNRAMRTILRPISSIYFFRGIFVLTIFFFFTGIAAAQSSFLQRYQNGIQLYDSSRWHEAAAEFRAAQELAENLNDWAQALYWVILSQLAYTDYGSAVRDMDELDRWAPHSSYRTDMLYHRARAYFNLGHFEDALFLFGQYIDSTPGTDRETSDRRAAAYFWMGESLFTMGQFDDAEKFYLWVIDRYPESPRREVSSYRVDLIKHKKIEAELLALLQWSHEESLRSSEEFQRTLRTYEFILNAYQRRITELTSGGQEELLPVDFFNDFSDLNELSQPELEILLEDIFERAGRLSIELEHIIDEYRFMGGLH
jgi:TolA-binding protein